MSGATPGLVQAACAGDGRAIDALLSACQPDLKRFARRTCASTEDAEDAVQLALWQLYRQIGALRAVAALATWLFRIVERECYRLYRGRQPAESLDLLPEQGQPLAPPVPLDLRIDLGRAIQQLPLAYREVLLLRDVHGLTAPEVAVQLGLGLAAVKSRLHRARALVRQQLLASGYWAKDGGPAADEPDDDAHPGHRP